MKFNVGDKVKFLNEKGGGVVTKMVSRELVIVMIDEGFEIPTPVSQLIRERTDKNNEPEEIEDLQLTDVSSDDLESRASMYISNVSAKALDEGIYLAFVPTNQHLLIVDDLEVYIVNHTAFDIIYNLFSKDDKGEYAGIDYSSIQAHSVLRIQSIHRDEIQFWAKGMIQLMFHQDKMQSLIMPLSVSFQIKPFKFYKETNYLLTPFFSKRALLLPLTEGNGIQHQATSIDKEEYDPAPIIKSKRIKTDELIDKHRINQKEAEVDLHIEELQENFSGLSNGDMLNIQISYFTKCLESAIANHLSKVVFIHGIGKGVLKTELIKILETYDGIHFFEASMAKYGRGAIEVWIKNN